MTVAHLDIERLDGRAADELNDVEVLSKAQEIVVIGKGPGAAAALDIGAIGRPEHRCEGDVAAPDAHAVCWIARDELDDRRNGGEGVLDQLTAEPHPHAGVIDQRSGAGKDRARFRRIAFHADIAQQPQGSLVKHFDLVIRDDGEPGIGIDDLPSRKLIDGAGATALAAAAGPGSLAPAAHPWRSLRTLRKKATSCAQVGSSKIEPWVPPGMATNCFGSGAASNNCLPRAKGTTGSASP
jgi:hypothetical protein